MSIRKEFDLRQMRWFSPGLSYNFEIELHGRNRCEGHMVYRQIYLFAYALCIIMAQGRRVGERARGAHCLRAAANHLSYKYRSKGYAPNWLFSRTNDYPISRVLIVVYPPKKKGFIPGRVYDLRVFRILIDCCQLQRTNWMTNCSNQSVNQPKKTRPTLGPGPSQKW